MEARSEQQSAPTPAPATSRTVLPQNPVAPRRGGFLRTRRDPFARQSREQDAAQVGGQSLRHPGWDSVVAEVRPSPIITAAEAMAQRDAALTRVHELEGQLEVLNREVAASVDEPALVWLADGALVYHRRRRCAGLVPAPLGHGQGPSLQGLPAAQDEIERVTRAQALQVGRVRCEMCF